MISKISRREQNVLIAGGTLIFIFLFFIYLLQPKWDKFQSDQAELAKMKSKIETLKVERAKKLKETPVTVETLKSQVRSLRSQLPVSKETAGFVNFIVVAADTAGLNLIDLKIGDESEDQAAGNSDNDSDSDSDNDSDGNSDNASDSNSKDNSKKKSDDNGESTLVKGTNILPVTIRVLGSYQQVRDFTINLESLKRLNHIKSIIFARDKSGIMMCEISIDAYSWAKGDPALNDSETIPKSVQPGKPDPYDSVGFAVYSDLGFNLRWDN